MVMVKARAPIRLRAGSKCQDEEDKREHERYLKQDKARQDETRDKTR